MIKIRSEILERHSILSVLSSIAESNTTKADLALEKKIKVFLKASESKEGVVISINNETLELLNKDGNSLIFVDINSISSVEVPILEDYNKILLKKGPWHLNLNEAPSNLQIQRKILEFSEKFDKKSVFLENKSTEALFLMDKILMALEGIFIKFKSDSIGSEALSQIHKIEFSYSEASNLELNLQGSFLSIKFGNALLSEDLAAELEKKLNSIL